MGRPQAASEAACHKPLAEMIFSTYVTNARDGENQEKPKQRKVRHPAIGDPITFRESISALSTAEMRRLNRPWPAGTA